MSKILYVNDKRVVMDEEKAYYPFTYTISDLEKVNIIGIPQSKSIDIPRCPENDEIFGYLGEITRTTFNFDNNEKVGVSFNQTKKGKYKLYNDSELVSAGQIQVMSATDSNYSIVLYDEIIDLIEQFEGDSDTGKSYLSDMDLIKSDNTYFSSNTNALLIKNLNNSSSDIIPTFNIKKYDTTGDNVRCSVQVGSTSSFNIGNITLPTELTPIQTRSVKNYEVDYCVPLNTVIRSINKYDLEGINPNLLKNTTDAWTNDTITDANSYAFLTDGISKAALGFVSGKTYTFSLTGLDFPDGQYYIALTTNNGGVYTYHAGSLASNGQRSSITYTIPSDFIEVYIYVTNNNVPVVGDTIIKYKEMKIEEGNEATKYIHNITDDFSYDYIKVDSELNDLFNEVHINCGSPKVNEIDIVEEKIDIDNLSQINLDAYYDIIINTNPDVNEKRNLLSNGAIPTIKNGSYKLNFTVDGEYAPLFTNPNNLILARYDNVAYVHPTYSSFPGETVVRCSPGTKFGELHYGLTISAYSNTTRKIETIELKNLLELRYQVNSFETLVSNKVTKLNTSHQAQIDFDLYPEFSDIDFDSIKLGFYWDNMLDNTNLLIGTKSSSYNYTLDFDIKDLSLTYTKGDLRTSDYFDGKNIFPKVSIKDFVINTCKFFNLDIVNDNGSLLIKNRKYFLSNEILVVDKVNEINTNIFDFNKLILTTNITNNELFESYEKSTKQKYGQQTINTGFNIKNNTKEINIPVYVPALMYDVNGYAYNNFTNYSNSGKSKGRYGVIDGFDDKLSFSYINRIDNDTLYVTNDTYFEGGMWSSEEPDNYPTEVNFTMNNRMLRYYNTGGFDFNSNITSDNSQSIRLTSFYTASPYKFDNSGVVIKSLEMNKPKFNYAGLTDVTYPLSSTLYYTYHRNMLIDKYNVDTHTIDCDLFCRQVPNINGIYNIKNSHYIISELGEYDPSTSGEIFTGVKLMKVNDINNYGLPDIYNIGIQQTISFDGNVAQYSDRPLGFNYNINGSSVVVGDADDFKLLSSKNFNNSNVSLVYDDDLDITKIIQYDSTNMELSESKTNKFNVNSTNFKYLLNNTESDLLLGSYNDTNVIIDSTSDNGNITNDNINFNLYLQTGSKKVTEALITDPVIRNLRCVQSGGLYYWLLDCDVFLSLTDSVIDLTSASRFKFDDIVIEAKEQAGDVNYTTFTCGHSDLLDVNYEYLGDGKLKFSFAARLFEASNYAGTIPDNIRDVYVIPYPTSDYNVKISINGLYNDDINSIDTDTINFGIVGSNLSYTLNEFTGNNETETTINAINYRVDYQYNKL